MAKDSTVGASQPSMQAAEPSGGNEDTGQEQRSKDRRSSAGAAAAAAAVEPFNGGAQELLEEQHPQEQVYQFAERFKQLFPDQMDPLPSQGSREALLQYLEKYLGEAPLPEEGETWAESLVKIFHWAGEQDIEPGDVDACFKSDGGAANDLLKLFKGELDVFYTTWTLPLKAKEVLKAQQEAKASKQRATQQLSPVAGGMPVSPSSGLPSAIAAAAAAPVAGQQAANPVALGSSEPGSAGGSPAGGSKALNSEGKRDYRVLLHLATSSSRVPLEQIFEREGLVRKVKDPERTLSEALRRLVSRGWACESTNESGDQCYEATSQGMGEWRSCRDRLWTHAKRESSTNFEEGRKLVGRRCRRKGFEVAAEEWFQGTIKDFDGWEHLVRYDDNDEQWHDLRSDRRDRIFEVLESHEGVEQEGAQEGKAPAVASKKRQGGIGSLAAVTGKKGRAACEEAVPAARAEGPMYGGSYDLVDGLADSQPSSLPTSNQRKAAASEPLPAAAQGGLPARQKQAQVAPAEDELLPGEEDAPRRPATRAQQCKIHGTLTGMVQGQQAAASPLDGSGATSAGGQEQKSAGPRRLVRTRSQSQQPEPEAPAEAAPVAERQPSGRSSRSKALAQQVVAGQGSAEAPALGVPAGRPSGKLVQGPSIGAAGPAEVRAAEVRAAEVQAASPVQRTARGGKQPSKASSRAASAPVGTSPAGQKKPRRELRDLLNTDAPALALAGVHRPRRAAAAEAQLRLAATARAEDAEEGWVAVSEHPSAGAAAAEQQPKRWQQRMELDERPPPPQQQSQQQQHPGRSRSTRQAQSMNDVALPRGQALVPSQAAQREPPGVAGGSAAAPPGAMERVASLHGWEGSHSDDEGARPAGSDAALPRMGGRQECYWLRREGRQAQKWLDKDHVPAGVDTVSCHACQRQHIRWPCQSGKVKSGTMCSLSYCLICIKKRYAYLLESGLGHPEDLDKFCQGWCPCCIGICNVRECLRKSLRQLGHPPPEVPVSGDQEVVAAAHLAFQLLEPAMQIYQENVVEARRQGMQLEDVPVVPIGLDEDGHRAPNTERVLCNQCATTIVNAHYSCSSCKQDICPSCVVETQEFQQGPVPCFACSKLMRLQQFFDRDRLSKLASAEQRLAQLFVDEESRSAEWLREVYDARHRQWFVGGQPLTEALQQLQGEGQQRGQPARAVASLANGSVSAGGQPQKRGTKRRAPVGGQAAAGAHQDSSGAPGVPAGEAQAAQSDHGGTTASAAAAGGAGRGGARGRGSEEGEAQERGQRGPQGDAACDAAAAAATAATGMNGHAGGSKRVRRPTAKAMEYQAGMLGSIQQVHPAAGAGSAGVSARAPAAGPQGRQHHHEAVQSNNVGGAAPHEAAEAEVGSLLHCYKFSPGSNTAIKKNRWWTLNPHTWVPQEDLRIAAQRPDGTQNVIWTPHKDIFAPGHPRRADAIRLFTERWLLGEPIVVRGFRGRMDWSPDTMARVTRDMRKKDVTLNVLDCADFKPIQPEISCHEFFKKYTACDGAETDANDQALPMHKLKDWPLDAGFGEKLARHNDDFLEMLNSCMPAYTHPTSRGTGVLNLANHLPWYVLKPDLGPKGYIAYGREKEHEGEGDSVTKLHEDLSEAINIMLHVQLPEGMEPPKPRSGLDQPWDLEHYGHAGAVWDIFRSQDRDALKKFLLACVKGQHPELPPFYHGGKRLTEEDAYHPIHAQCFMLTEAHRKVLRQQYNVHPWHIEQYGWEGVFVPGGTPHQVRNLRSSIKVALDFVTPEALEQCSRLRREFRKLVLDDAIREEDPGSYHYSDRLQVRNMIIGGLEWALDKLEEYQRRVQDASGAPHAAEGQG